MTQHLPRVVIDAFVTAHRNSLEVLHDDFQWIVRRVKNPCWQLQDCLDGWRRGISELVDAAW